MLRVAEEFHGSHTGRQRPANEDSLYARAPLFAVADGMGGAQAGEIASGMAVEALGHGVPDGGPAEEQLAELVREANGRIHELSRTDERRAGMGTTMTAILVGPDEVTIAHVGDSRAYRLRDGALERLTRDHSLVEELLREGKLTPEQALEHPQRSVITRALGPEPTVQVDTETWRARDGDVVLLCSDGLTTMLDDERIAATLRGAGSLEQAGRGLIDAANEAGGRDNITVVLVRLEDVHAGAAAPEDDQATATGADALRAADVQAAVEAEQRDRPVAVADPPTRTVQRLKPLPPDRPAAVEGRRLRRRRALILLGIFGFVLVPIGLGAFAALRSVYFVGSDEGGFVSVYRGLPYELPLGADLYQRVYVSGMTRELVPTARREAIFDHSLRSRDDAYELVRELERGRLVSG